ncbi:MAG: hypothetical protein UR66_C0003G0040 [Candidatus Moranbacteria bacterium GW2011_GWE1_35_17]|nr:MAG: hypothetical protein UR66_C0003G0040 [Candidatus Moranbacteria bacterium GW2011_GWE1_35_17]KKP71967.1 MAG: hypothetical protein UR65_C0022G0006 [Candidatus Moranbacteria bacterium GW2011_GWE2_35_164]KKP84189.1 MAG: hypothetical protein UR82_C0010G0007 [Candidatus Moranbacteria bacterium GW2011_GWF1_35_5]
MVRIYEIKGGVSYDRRTKECLISYLSRSGIIFFKIISPILFLNSQIASLYNSILCYYINSFNITVCLHFMSIFNELLLFFSSIIFLLFLPGYFLLLAIFRKKINQKFSPIEIAVIAFATSLITFDFLFIIFGKIGFNINRNSILAIISFFILACYGIYKLKAKKETASDTVPKKNNSKLEFNKIQTILIILILFLTIFLKTSYLANSIFPTSTDLGHHMYWSKLVAETGQLPHYQKNEIIQTADIYQLKTNPIADFIIGEHLIFSGINLLSKISFISYFPALTLFLINIFGILAMFILSLRIFDLNFRDNTLNKKIFNPANLAILTLFLIGPFYAITSPQAKFISGGVIGNLIGNLLIPLCLYFYFRAIKEKDSWMLFLAIFLSAGLFYTHHLSGFIFIFILIFIILIFNFLFILKNIQTNTSSKIRNILSNYKNLAKDFFHLFFSPPIITLLIFALLFLFFVYTPSYIVTDAKTTVVGAPSKSTRAGLTLEQFKYAVGEMRLAFGIVGFFIISGLIFIKKKLSIEKNIIYTRLLMPSLLFGWALALFMMTTKPQWMRINIPSDRVANYANFPFIILAATGILYLLFILKELKNNFIISKKIQYFLFLLFFSTIIFMGYYDNSSSLSQGQKNQKALQTFHASEFLANQIKSHENLYSANIIKDHNYISADSWMKLFFMTDYNYPLSRGYFKRYEDITKPREMCTLWMISEPSSQRAQNCFSSTNTKYIIVDTSVDGPQFKASSNFSKIYEGNSLSIFSKNNR